MFWLSYADLGVTAELYGWSVLSENGGGQGDAYWEYIVKDYAHKVLKA